MHHSTPYHPQACMLPPPVYFLVSAPPVIWHSVQRILVRITHISDTADGTRWESTKHHQIPSSPSCTASVQKCRNNSVPVFYRDHRVSATWPVRFYQDQIMNQQPIRCDSWVFSNPPSCLGGSRFKVWPTDQFSSVPPLPKIRHTCFLPHCFQVTLRIMLSYDIYVLTPPGDNTATGLLHHPQTKQYHYHATQ